MHRTPSVRLPQALAELTLVACNRDIAADANGCIPKIVSLLSSRVVGTPTAAARVLAHLSQDDQAMSSQHRSREEEGGSPVKEGVGPGKDRGEGTGATSFSSSKEKAEVAAGNKLAVGGGPSSSQLCDQKTLVRRTAIFAASGVHKLIAMLGGSLYKRPWTHVPSVIEEQSSGGAPISDADIKVAMQERAAAALAEIAYGSPEMQDAVVEASGVPPLLNLIRTGSQLAQEHASRAIWHLCAQIKNQEVMVECGTIHELVMLLKSGSPQAQEVAAAGIMDLAHGAIVEQQERDRGAMPTGSAGGSPVANVVAAAAEQDVSTTGAVEEPAVGATVEADSAAMSEGSGVSPASRRPSRKPSTEAHGPGARRPTKADANRLVTIAEKGIVPLVALLGSSNSRARENAAGALWHLALHPSNQIAIARANGISPLVTMLDDGTDVAHEHAANALDRLAREQPDNQAHISKYCVALLSSQNTGAQRRAARVLREIAASNPSSPVVIINAGAISPLVQLLSSGQTERSEEAAAALLTLADSPSTQLAIATGLVALLGVGSGEAQEHVTHLLRNLALNAEIRSAIAKAGAIPRLIMQVMAEGRV